MPIREYRCHDCDASFERVELAARPAPATCPSCGTDAVEQLFSAFAVGSGASGAMSAAAAEPGPCGGCGAAQRGACGFD